MMEIERDEMTGGPSERVDLRILSVLCRPLWYVSEQYFAISWHGRCHDNHDCGHARLARHPRADDRNLARLNAY